jgi:hypothetical protein
VQRVDLVCITDSERDFLVSDWLPASFVAMEGS